MGEEHEDFGAKGISCPEIEVRLALPHTGEGTKCSILGQCLICPKIEGLNRSIDRREIEVRLALSRIGEGATLAKTASGKGR